MTEYVLEILDGDRAGEVITLQETRFTMGRKPGHPLSLKDEKASGNHAEIVFEDGRYVLRDLESTNGTLMDGRKVQEVALTPQDIFQIGLTRILFKEKGAASTAPGADLHMHRIDQAMLARSRRRSPLAIVGLVVVLGAAGGVWFFMHDSGDKGTGRRGPRGPERVANNLLPVGADSFEADGFWDLTASGQPFRLGGAPHSGTAALEASWGSETKAGHALARLKDPIAIVSTGEALELRGQMRASGGGRGALRLRFTSSVDSDASSITSGTVPAASEGWSPVQLQLAIPPGMDRVQAEVLALLPGEGATVAVDDLVLLRASGGPEAINLNSGNGRNLFGAGSSLAIRSQGQPVLLAARPAATQGALASLAADGLATFSDAGVRTEVSAAPSGFALTLQALQGGQTGGMVLELPEASGASLMVRPESGVFQAQAIELHEEHATDILLGAGITRLMVHLDAPGPAAGSTKGGRYRLELPQTAACRIVVEFEKDTQAARAAEQEGRTLEHQEHYAQALDKLREVIEQHPQPDEVLRPVQKLRADILERLAARLEQIRTDLAQVRFFQTRGDYVRLDAEIQSTVDAFGMQSMPKPDTVQAMQSDVRAEIVRLTAADDERHGQQLAALAEVLERSGQDALRDLVKDYMQRHQGK